MINKQHLIKKIVCIFSFILLAYTSECYGQNPVTVNRVKKATSAKAEKSRNSNDIGTSYIDYNQKRHGGFSKKNDWDNPPDLEIIQLLIERYCNAICENDFETLASLYAPIVERFQGAYKKDRDYVIGCHQRYDKTFKVYGKHSSIRWDSFEMRMMNNGQLSVKVVEDYSIDREDKSKYSFFVLEKHFIIDPSYHIVSVYDKQLSKAKSIDNYKSIYQKYVGDNLLEYLDEYAKWGYVYIDDDDIPELLISTSYPPTGSYLLSIVDGKVVESLESLYVYYIPRQNRILSHRGLHMNEIIMYIGTFNKLLVTIKEDYDDGDNMRDEPLWYVDDKEVSEQQAKEVIEFYFERFGESQEPKLRPMKEFWQ